jgi:phosphohistidine phosphatase
MNLIILRHGEAGNRLPSTSRDFERELTASGRKEVEAVAEALDDLKVEVSHIVTSPLKRAKETAIVAAKVLKKQDLVEVWDELKPEATTSALYARLSKLKQESSVMLVGHDPYLSAMIGELIAGTPRARIVLKKAGVARVDVSSFAPKPTGELKWLLTPKQLRKVS